ncbi:MAG: L-serine ammonia-lyase, iron-sulfur-dependent, subunit alpha [Lachnospiraceae bacterium]|nr:L-serine ammonia-lyase, iron-sulfur-dependent, subunit alpha [Lachnospiraceae bacterium]
MFEALQDIISICETENKEFWQVVLQDDVSERHVTEQESLDTMKATWDAMLAAARDYDANLRSNSGLVGGDGAKMDSFRKNIQSKEPLCGDFVLQSIAGALQMGESNACMKRIVAAPTAGACGVLPAVLVPYYNEQRGSLDDIIHALYVAAGIGQVIAHRASISGAAGGCQAEIGSASAMAAGALVYLQGGNANQIAQSVAMALKNLLGLVCDPVAGLVEVPCVKRNVIGAVNALSCADMTMAGISSRIPPDQVIDAMGEVGDKMDASLRETALGGLAATPAAIEFVSALKPNDKN